MVSARPCKHMNDLQLSEVRQRVIRLWLWAVAAIVFALVVVGGATRLTESGLSIVEWRPVTGVLPPLSHDAWQGEFEKYQKIPQFLRNTGMTLDEFKTIYWWEWAHRLLGRFVGVAFLVPFLWFLWRGWIVPGLRGRLWLIFGLGALQGAIGWWMVASGLSERVEVSQYRLAVHLLLASLIFAALVWTAQRLAPGPRMAGPPRVRAGAAVLLALVLAQIYLGAIVAGLRAGYIYTTWPLIDGAYIPEARRLFFEVPLWRNFFENTLTAQFDHRMMAYMLFVLAIVHAADAVGARAGGVLALVLAAAMTAQVAVGIVTLLQQAPIELALIHQAMAMIVLAIAVAHVERRWPLRRGAAEYALSAR